MGASASAGALCLSTNVLFLGEKPSDDLCRFGGHLLKGARGVLVIGPELSAQQNRRLSKRPFDDCFLGFSIPACGGVRAVAGYGGGR
jgi:hypothetical protein